MSASLQRNRQNELKKRVLSFSACGLGLYLLVSGSPVLGLLASGLGGYLVWDWFRFRARNGMRF